MWLTIILGVLTGLGLLLYGIQMMATGLQKVAGNRLKFFVEFLTRNRFIALLVGMIITIIVHSSSATSVMVVGFVNSGIMSLQQAVGVIMGANIGTTVTGQLLSFNLTRFAPIALAIGLVLQLTGKTTKRKNLAEVLIGMGILFIGMSLLKDAMNPLKGYPKFEEYLIRWGSNPFLGISLGIIITVLMQSSAATIALLIALGSEGILPLEAAIYILYGDNIGTCTTALFSSIGSSRNARRIAFIHLLFNIIGTVIFVLLLGKPLLKIVTAINPTDVARQIANSHSLFNIVNVIILFPLAGFLVKISEIVIPNKDDKIETPILDPRFLGTPAIALKNTVTEIINMANMAKNSLECAILSYRNRDKLHIEESNRLEEQINNYQHLIMVYLQDISETDLSKTDRRLVDALFNTVSDIERIGDHADNIAELSNNFIDQDVEFDPESKTEIRAIIDHVLHTLSTLIDALRLGDVEKAKEVILLEDQMDIMERESRQNYINRMHEKKVTIQSGVIFLDLLSNLERVLDHCNNIAQSIIALQGDIRIPFIEEDRVN
ncbi:MAG: Na/Pi cotransporter family protein [Tissierellia bacterium]|nr:Na/Pi cotransporter family protein [Tissierellia bacterium]